MPVTHGGGKTIFPDDAALRPLELVSTVTSGTGAHVCTYRPAAADRVRGVLDGGCACGEVRYRLTSSPLFTHCCHCLNCQRQTGSAFVVNVLIETDRVELLAGEPQPVDVPRSGGKKQRIFRCPTCQIALFSRYTSAGIRFVRAGTLDDPSSVAPDVHIYTRSKLSWVVLPDSVPAFATYYDTKKLWPGASLERLQAITARR